MKRHSCNTMISWLIILSMLILFVPATVSAASGTAPQTGDGSVSNPYIIDEASELVWISENMATAAFGTSFNNAYFLQTADIDMSSIADFTPIGNYTTNPLGIPFSGQYDGQKYKITNLKINSGYLCVGLFQNVSGTVKNVILENANIASTISSSSSYSGGIAGVISFGTISGCGVSGNILSSGASSGSFTGGIAGQCYGSITNCWSTASLKNESAGSTIGGMTGYTAYQDGIISTSYFAGTIKGSGTSIIGGIVGNDYQGGLSGNLYSSSSASFGRGDSRSDLECARTTPENMMKQASYVSPLWNFTSIWKIAEGTGYPQFITMPAAPSNVAITIGYRKLTISWDKTYGANGYNVYVGKASGAYSTRAFSSGTSVTIINLLNHTPYYVCVKAMHNSEEGPASTEMIAVPRSTPIDLTATPGSGSASLTFSAPIGADTVELQQSKDDGATFTTVSGLSLSSSSTSASVTGLSNGTNYIFRLRMLFGTTELFSNQAYVLVGDKTKTLSALSVNGESLNVPFEPGVLDYTLTVSEETASIGVTATLESALSTLILDGAYQESGVMKNVLLPYGRTDLIAKVTAENGYLQDYTITIDRPFPAGVAEKVAYKGTDSWSSSPFIYVGSWDGFQEHAAISFNLGDYTEAPGSATLYIYVDLTQGLGDEASFKIYGSNTGDWTLDPAPDPLAVLTGTEITYDSSEISEGWVSIDVTDFVKTSIESSQSIATFFFEGDLKATSNDIAFYSPGDINKPKLILQESKRDGSLSSIKINGTDLPGFTFDTYIYDYDIPHAADASLYTFTSTLSESGDTKGDWVFRTADNSWAISVTSADGLTEHIYVVNMKPAAKSSDATLSSITVNGTALSGFAPDAGDYTYAVLHGTNGSTVSISSVVNDHMGTQAGWTYNSGTMKWSNTVTAEDGTTQKTYSITINELPDTDAKLSSISVNGSALIGFNSSKYSYNYNVLHGTNASGLTFSSVKSDPNATMGTWTYNDVTRKWSVTVTAEDGTTEKTYTVTIIELPSMDAMLSSISIGGTPIDGFSYVKYGYTVIFPHGTDASALSLSCITHDHMATVGTWSYDAGTHRWSVMVTAEDGSTARTYTVTINVLPDTDAKLSSISVNATAVSNFSSSKYDYTFDVAHETDASALTLTSVKSDPNATVGSWSYDADTMTWSVTVTAEDGKTQKTYTVKIKELPDTDATLSSISVNGSALIGFDSSIYGYNYNVIHGTDASGLTLSSVKSDPNATVGTWTYNAATRKWSITVTAEDGTTEKIYTVTVIELPSTDPTLSSISIGGTPINGFSSLKYGYTVIVPHGTDASALSLSCAANDHMATVGTWSYDAGTQKWSVTVTAEDGKTARTYTVTISVLPDTDATLSSISVNGTEISEFAKLTTNYIHDVVHGTDASALTLTSVKSDPNATAGSWIYDADTLTWTVMVTAEDETTQKTYTVKINELPSTDANLSSISINDMEISGFTASTTDYIYDVVHGTDPAALILTSEKNDHNASVGSWSYDDSTRTWSVTVTAEDSTTQKIYTVMIHELPSTDATLASINFNGYPLSGFSPATTEYSYDVAHGTDASIINVSSAVNDHMGIQSDWTYDAGTQKWSVTVTAEDGTTTKTYTITIHELPDTDATLKSISINGKKISGFVSSTLTYTVDVIHGTDKAGLILTSEKSDPNASVGSWTYDAGTQKWSVTVTAEDGTTTKTYTVTIHELPSTDATLTSISVDGIPLAGFSAATSDYIMNVAYGVDGSAFRITSKKSDHNATAGTWTYDAGTKKWSMTVTAEDGTTKKTYTITVNEANPPLPTPTVTPAPTATPTPKPTPVPTTPTTTTPTTTATETTEATGTTPTTTGTDETSETGTPAETTAPAKPLESATETTAESGNPSTPTPESGSLWIWIVVAVVLAGGAVTFIFLFLKRRKHR